MIILGEPGELVALPADLLPEVGHLALLGAERLGLGAEYLAVAVVTAHY